MSNEYKDQMLQLLTEVDNVKAKEAALQSEKKRHQDQIAQSEAELQRTQDDIEQCRESALALRGTMDDLKNEIFARPDDEEEAIVEDTAHIVTADGASPESEGQKLWRDRQKQLKSVQ